MCHNREVDVYRAGLRMNNALVLGNSVNIAINDISLKTRFFGLHFRRRLYRSNFNHFDVIGPKGTEFGGKKAR